MKISVITVCYNEEKNIAKTIESVLNQTSKSIEYIICDGKSTDKTVEIAESYVDKFKANGVDYRVYSEKDGGIYAGMNNGIDRANGDYVIFTNAGDRLFDENVIAQVIDALEDKRPEVVYGNCLFVDRCVGVIFNADHTQLSKYMSIAHPATLVRTDIIKQNRFETSFKIAADYNMMLDLYNQNYEFFKL
jgi:glycosyltransferase involved in cell wall biosynthesis